uniref:Uncharacterized protein n=1 Tax=Romanomermis culicivorax TaxID=13658 RepID=A0A915IFV1_ROMCU
MQVATIATPHDSSMFALIVAIYFYSLSVPVTSQCCKFYEILNQSMSGISMSGAGDVCSNSTLANGNPNDPYFYPAAFGNYQAFVERGMKNLLIRVIFCTFEQAHCLKQEQQDYHSRQKVQLRSRLSFQQCGPGTIKLQGNWRDF